MLNLSLVLEREGISKNEFARRLGVPKQTVRPYFRPGYDPKLSTLLKWSHALECGIDELIDAGQKSKRRSKNAR